MLSQRGYVFFFKQKTAYEMRISDWSSDVCSSDLMASGTCVREVQCFRGATHAAGLGHLYKQFNLGPAVHRRLIVSRVGKVFSSLGVLKFFLAAYTIF